MRLTQQGNQTTDQNVMNQSRHGTNYTQDILHNILQSMLHTQNTYKHTTTRAVMNSTREERKTQD